MYEGKPPKRDASTSLQTVSWADLSARLAAARDLRSAFAHDEPGEGSFDAVSARWIADHADGKHDVNPNDLGNRKAAEGIADGDQVPPTPDDRGKE